MGEKLRVLLIEPSDPWVANNQSLRHCEPFMVPVGLMSLSAYLKQQFPENVEVRIVNTIIDLDEIDDLRDVLSEFKPQIVGVRCVMFYGRQVRRIAEMSRAIVPDALILGGGPAASTDSTLILGDANFDAFVVGEGERTLEEIVGIYLEGGRTQVLNRLPSVKGVVCRRDEGIQKTAQRELIENIDTLSVPDYSGIDFDRYTRFLNYGYNRRPMAALFTSRGCPYRCTYCHDIFGKRFRFRNAVSVYNEVATLNRDFGIKDFCVVDDNFAFDSRRVEEFADLLIEKGPKVNLYFPNGLRGDALAFTTIDKLVEAGTKWITMSLETASERLQKQIKKNLNVSRLQEVVEYCCDKGIVVNLCLMVGFPSETREEAEHSLRFFSGFKRVVMPFYFSLKYYPGTEVYNQAEEFGIRVDDESYWEAYHHNSFQETPLLSRKDFEELNQWYLRHVFLNGERLRNSVVTLRRHHSEEEINDMFSLFFRRGIANVETDVLSYAMS